MSSYFGADPLAIFITFRTYGSFLHGDERGAVDRNHNGVDAPLLPTNSARVNFERASMKHAEMCLIDSMRDIVERAIHETCEKMGWTLQVINVRTNHVHLVVSTGERPERVMNSLKSWSTKRLREAGAIFPEQRPWSRHGSTRWLWKPEQVSNACRYVLEGQGDDTK